jgi:hypothetical protein
VPTATQLYKHIYPKTAYEREFNDRVDQLGKASTKNPWLQSFADQAISKQFECSTGEGTIKPFYQNQKQHSFQC